MEILQVFCLISDVAQISRNNNPQQEDCNVHDDGEENLKQRHGFKVQKVNILS